MKKFTTYIATAVASVVMVGPAHAAVNKQVVIDKSLAAYSKALPKTLDKGERLKSLSATCAVYGKVLFDCTFTAKVTKAGKGRTYRWPMIGVVRGGARSTYINRYLNGRVSLTSKNHIAWEIAG
jgi:hypothetical protein